ncbi:MAG: cell division protein FtsZ [Ignavibacteriae bacterium HGW-Ignavibacteriae-1]|jgi:cell division protein FtsZ|nr:MAG: cell division protein FtsZ [Ignavibacteriae bacterium HGW-Ignavibacteriae-1]
MPIGIDTTISTGARIRVIGVGGGGGNAINNMISSGLESVDFIAVNTDAQALEHNLAKTKIQIGDSTTRGLGAGGNWEVGQKAAEESITELKEVIKGSDMVFVTAGMGGGTGTGAAPVIAQTAKEMGALVVGVVTKPFQWEGIRRGNSAKEGISRLKEGVDALIIIPNQRLLEIIDHNTSFKDAFKIVDGVLLNATRGISEIISCHGTVNVDFADVKAIMSGMGDAIMGIGIASGENRAEKATAIALNSPLLDGVSIKGAQGVLVNITGGDDLTMSEIARAVTIVEQEAGEDTNLIHGVVQNPNMNEQIMVTVVATGFNQEEEPVPLVEKVVETERKETPRVMEIPFPAKPQAPKFPVPKVPRGYYQERTGIMPPNLISSSPRGEEQLRKFDMPAFQRRGKELSIITNTSENSAESSHEMHDVHFNGTSKY